MGPVGFWLSGCSVLLLPWLDYCSAVTLSPCVDDGGNVAVAEVERGKTSRFYCRGLQTTDTVQWRYFLDDTTEVSAGSCGPLNSNPQCSVGSLFPTFTASRTSNTESVMTVDPTTTNGENTVGGGTLGCKTSPPNALDTCKMDLISPAQGTCSVRFGVMNDVWQTTGRCDLTTAQSSRSRYWCRWFRTKGSSQETYQNQVGYTLLSKVCRFNEPLPTDNGLYSYRVKVTPGEVSIPASFPGAGDNEIKTPSVPTVTGCPSQDYQAENTTVRCTCTTGNVGKPAGRLQWFRIGSSSPLATGDYGNKTLTLSHTLQRGDHNRALFRCDVDWAADVTGATVTFKVGYKPENLSLRLGSSPQVELTVMENDTIPFTCEADGRPTARMTLSREGGSVVSGGLSPLFHSLRSAQCSDTGTYICSADNVIGQGPGTASVKLYVRCIPRSSSADLPAVTFRGQPVAVFFEVTSFPPPASTFTFSYLGPEGIGAPSEVKEIHLVVTCQSKPGVEYMYTCSVIVLNVTSPEAAGFYTVRVSNGDGYLDYKLEVRFKVAEDTTTGRVKAELQSYFGVAVGLGVVLAMIVIFGVIVVVVSVLWLKRHQWILPCTDVDQLHRTSSKDLPTSERSRTITKSCIQTEQMEDTGGAATRGPYDSLQMSDIGLRSVYSEIGHSDGRDTRSASGEAGGLYENSLR